MYCRFKSGYLVLEKTLTIEPGTIIKGKPGSGSLASALIVQRGSTHYGQRTAVKPNYIPCQAITLGVDNQLETNFRS